MSAVLQPFGMKPVYHPSGLDRQIRFNGTFWTGTTNTKSYNTATTFYEFMPITINVSGVIDVAQATAGSATTTQVYGVFMGAEYNTPTGERRVSKYYTDNLASTTSDAQVIFWLHTDPEIVYEIQANGSVPFGSVGGQFNFVNPGAGIVIGTGGGAGFSTAALNATEVATGVQGQVRCVDLGRAIAYPSSSTATTPNAWGDAFTVLQVKIANNSFVAPKPNL